MTLYEMIYSKESEIEQEQMRDYLIQEIESLSDNLQYDLEKYFKDILTVDMEVSKSLFGGCFPSRYITFTDEEWNSVTIRLSDGHNNGNYSGSGSYDFLYENLYDNYEDIKESIIALVKKELLEEEEQ